MRETTVGNVTFGSGRTPHIPSYIPPPPEPGANRQGQRELVAATLAAGMIAAAGKPVTAAEAMKVMKEAYVTLWPSRDRDGNVIGKGAVNE